MIDNLYQALPLLKVSPPHYKFYLHFSITFIQSHAVADHATLSQVTRPGGRPPPTPLGTVGEVLWLAVCAKSRGFTPQ